MIGRASRAAAAAVLLAATSTYADQPAPSPCPGWPEPAAASAAAPSATAPLTPAEGGQLVGESMHPAHVVPAAVPVSRSGAAGLRVRGVRILDEYLAARIHQLEERSPRFRAAMTLARLTPIPVILGTPEQVRSHLAPLLLPGETQSSARLGDVVVQRCEPDSPRIGLIVVRIYQARLRSAARWHAPFSRRRSHRWLDSITDAVLIHEIWGHLIPILEAGDFSGHCPDPAPGQPDAEACAMQRENELRRELGLLPRQRYALRLPGS